MRRTAWTTGAEETASRRVRQRPRKKSRRKDGENGRDRGDETEEEAPAHRPSSLSEPPVFVRSDAPNDAFSSEMRRRGER